MHQKRGQEPIVRSTLRAVSLLVPDPFSDGAAPFGPLGYWYLTPFSAPARHRARARNQSSEFQFSPDTRIRVNRHTKRCRKNPHKLFINMHLQTSSTDGWPRFLRCPVSSVQTSPTAGWPRFLPVSVGSRRTARLWKTPYCHQTKNDPELSCIAHAAWASAST